MEIDKIYDSIFTSSILENIFKNCNQKPTKTNKKEIVKTKKIDLNNSIFSPYDSFPFMYKGKMFDNKASLVLFLENNDNISLESGLTNKFDKIKVYWTIAYVFDMYARYTDGVKKIMAESNNSKFINFKDIEIYNFLKYKYSDIVIYDSVAKNDYCTNIYTIGYSILAECLHKAHSILRDHHKLIQVENTLMNNIRGSSNNVHNHSPNEIHRLESIMDDFNNSSK